MSKETTEDPWASMTDIEICQSMAAHHASIRDDFLKAADHYENWCDDEKAAMWERHCARRHDLRRLALENHVKAMVRETEGAGVANG